MNPLDPMVLAVAVVVSVSVVVTLVRVVWVVVVVVAAMVSEPTAWTTKRPRVSMDRRALQGHTLVARSVFMPDQGSLGSTPPKSTSFSRAP